MKNLLTIFLLGLGLFVSGCASVPPENKTVRVAVIGGMMATGLWPEIASRFEAESGYKVEVVSAGPRDVLSGDFRAGKADLLTMHSGDITTDLVADGFGTNMRPWTRNELVIAGHISDPAKIHGLHDGALALQKIAEAKAPFVDVRDIGSREMTHNLWKKAGINPQGDWVIKDEAVTPQDILTFAREHKAYAIVGRIPVLNGKIPSEEMQIMVQGDPAMRRPYIVMEASSKKFPHANSKGARALSDYLLSAKTQKFLLEFGRETGRPLFFPISEK